MENAIYQEKIEGDRRDAKDSPRDRMYEEGSVLCREERDGDKEKYAVEGKA